MSQSFARRFMLAMIGGFLILVLVGLVGLWTLRQAELQGERVAHTYQVENALREYVTLNERMETARRGFLLSSVEAFAARVERSAAEADAVLARLLGATADNPAQQERLVALGELTARYVGNTRDTIATRRQSSTLDARSFFLGDDGVPLIEAIRAQTDEIITEERELLRLRTDSQNRTQTLSFAILALAAFLLIALAVATIVFTRRNVAELQRSRKVLEGMNEMLEGAVEVRTADLQRANAEIQRFAYIVSHDLRSPLVNVMGFTSELEAATSELRALVDRAEETAPLIVTEEARLAAREDLPEAIGFIRSSTQKMDRLINAILRLSREGRRVITPEPIEMNALIETITDTIQHRLGEIESTVSVEGTLPDIVTDRVAVEQIFSNLIENAVKYRKPDRPVHVVVRGRKVGARVLFEVEDDGRGIDPRDHERVFDLFRRSGAQDRPGEGIGLAHVRAMAYRLGGTVDCESALDAGATFRLSIPETFSGNQEG